MHAPRCNTLLLQSFAALGLQPKALQEANLLGFCSFFVQMNCAPQLNSALPVVFLGVDVNLATARCRLQQLTLLFPTKGTSARGHQMPPRHVCNLQRSFIQGPFRPKVRTETAGLPASYTCRRSQTCILGPQTRFIHSLINGLSNLRMRCKSVPKWEPFRPVL